MFFTKNAAAYYLTVGLKKGRRLRKIDVSTDSVPEFELGDTAADIQWRRQEKEAKERKEAQQQRTKGGVGQERGGKSRGNTLARGGSCIKKGENRTKVTLRMAEKRNHHSHDTRRRIFPTSISLTWMRRVLWTL